MSYGINAPQGLQPFRYLNGALWNGQQNAYRIDPTLARTFYTGDPVSLDADGVLQPGADSNLNTIGVFNGCRYIAAQGGNSNNPIDYASLIGPVVLAPGQSYVTAFVIDDPNVLFNAQVNVGLNGIQYSDVGQNVNYAAGAGSSITGQSGYALDYASINAALARNLTIYDITPVIGNVAAVPFNNALVLINNHRFKSGVAGAV